MNRDTAGAIVGVGVDAVDVARFRRVLRRRPRLAARCFTESERSDATGSADMVQSLAARFAAKEAVAKALGAPPGLLWTDVTLRSEPSGKPVLDVRGTVAKAAADLGVSGWHVSISHDGGLAVAMVVAER